MCMLYEIKKLLICASDGHISSTSYRFVAEVTFNEKNKLKKQKFFAILSWEPYSLQKWQFYCLHLISRQNTRLVGKLPTVTAHQSNPHYQASI